MAYKTFTGIDAKEIPAALAKIFEDTKAYKGVPGGADLTDINTGHMLERITEVFGPKGLGWNFVFLPEYMEIVNPLEKRVLARLKYAIFKYMITKEDGQEVWIEIPTSGANTNELAYAEEGARTSALGAAIKGLCFQLPIYKGLLDHHNAASEISKSKAKAKAEGSDVCSGWYCHRDHSQQWGKSIGTQGDPCVREEGRGYDHEGAGIRSQGGISDALSTR